MKVVLACGGTGGHVFPGLATAHELAARSHEVELWLAGKDVEPLAAAGWPGTKVTVPAEGLPSGCSWHAIKSLWTLTRSAIRCVRIMRPSPPDVVLAMGSYASFGPAVAALLLRKPLVLHEANVIPGRVISLLAPWAAEVTACFDATRYYLRRKDLVVSGMPLRPELEHAAMAPPIPRPPQAPFSLLVTGGSHGARQLNRVASRAVCDLAAHLDSFRVVHLTGANDEEAVRSRYATAGVAHEVRAFCSDMARLYLESDFAVCRSGASTCAELAAFGLPALLVPYPHATRNHQMANARALEKTGAADVIPEQDLSVEWLSAYLRERIRQPEKRARMRRAAREGWRGRAAPALADVMERVARPGGENAP